MQLGSRRINHSGVVNFLNSISLLTPLRIWTADTSHETCLFILNLYSWFSKPFSQHKSIRTFYTPLPQIAELEKPSPVRRVLAQVNGMGWEKTRGADTYYKTPLEVCCSSAAELQRIKGVDRVLSQRIVDFMVEGKE